MIILHEYRTGRQFSIWPADIRGIEQNEGYALIAHTMPFQAEEQVAMTPSGPRKMQPPIQVMLTFTEVYETVEEIQNMVTLLRVMEQGFHYDIHPVICERAVALAKIARDAVTTPFGNGPRLEVANA